MEKPREFLGRIEEDVQFDRWVEFISAIVLALATIATAWCGYQAALWGGEQARFATQSTKANIESARLSNEALLLQNLYANLFVAWTTAIGQDNQELADFLYERFPQEMKAPTAAWISLEPLTNPDAPPTPFSMPEFSVQAKIDSQEQARLADEFADRANEANDIGDRYVLLTVIFASVLFFEGISGKFKSRVIDLGMLVVGAIVFLAGVVVTLTFPTL